MTDNKNLNHARNNIDDEFYTLYEDIEAEISQYDPAYFKNMHVYLNCDDPLISQFYAYFKNNFKVLKLKKLTCTGYKNRQSDLMGSKPDAVLKYTIETVPWGMQERRVILKGDGSYDSAECMSIFKDADLIITNPPFSLKRKYIHMLDRHKKDFITISTINSIDDPLIFSHFKTNKWKLGYTTPKQFTRPDGAIKSVGQACWMTSLNIDNGRHMDIEQLKITKYDAETGYLYREHAYHRDTGYKFKPLKSDHPDRYDMGCIFEGVLNLDSRNDIPCNYDGLMGVPVSIIERLNHGQFKLINVSKGARSKRLKINGRELYKRVIIQRVGDAI